MITRQISHYRILDKIGSGGMGEVYLAEDARLGRKLALKILPIEFTKHPDRVARFEQEARAASALNHPNIITIYEIGSESGIHFIATEYIEGRTLRSHLSGTSLNLRAALEIVIQIAGALSAAHDAGITHRDIKPENIMIRPDGYVKVLDFGLAKLTEKSDSNVDEDAATRVNPQTDPGVIMGTVTYMSPEQARGMKIDARSDIFSLGILLYELVTGRAPFDGKTNSDVLAAILRAEPEPLSRYSSDIPAKLEWSVAKALKKECEDRYQTVKTFLADLQRVRTRLDFEMELTRLGRTDNPISSASEIGEALTVEFKSDEWRKLKSASEYQPRSSARTIDSLAILPLANDGDDPNMDYLSDGITESIINSLSQSPKLRVAPRSTVFRYKGGDEDPQQIGEQLGVRAVLTGRIMTVGDSLIVRTELIDIDHKSQLWGEQYRRKVTDIFELQDEIAEEISDKLRLRLSGEEKLRMIKRYTDNTEAYHLYLKGRYYVGKRTPDWIKKGIENFQQAIDLDPNYALAFSGLAEAYGFMASSTGGQPPRDAYPLAKAAAMKALELDETLGEAHCSLGFFRLLYDWDYEGAGREYRRAIELSPNFANAYDGLGFYFKAVGLHDEAIASCKRAQELEPLSLFLSLSLGWAFYFARRYDEALEQSRKVLEMDPNFGFAYWHRGMVYLQKKSYEEAIAAFRKAVNLSGGISSFIAYLGYACAKAGRIRDARQMLAQLQSLSKRQYVSSYFIGVSHLGLNEVDQAFKYFDLACVERSGFLAFAKVEPMLDQIRSDKRFAALLEKMESMQTR